MPLPAPRPMRLRFLREPGAGWRLCNFIMAESVLLYFFDANKMGNGTYHAADRGRVVVHDHFSDPAESQRLYRTLMAFERLDNAPRLCNP